MSTVSPTSSGGEREPGASSAWRLTVLCLLALLAGTALLYRQTLADLTLVWRNNAAYGHVVLLAPLSAWLIWRVRHRLAAIAPRGSPWGVVLAVALSLVWAVSALVDVRVIQQVALLGMIGALVLAVGGWRVFAILAFPVGFLVFAVPIWSHLVPVLQDATATVAASTLQTLRVPVFHEGYFLTIPNGRFVVAEVCAGLRFLMAMMTITALYAYLNFSRGWLGVLFFVFGVLAGITSNWLRVLTIILIGHFAGMDHPLVGSQHTNLGWVVFALTLLPVFAVGAWMARFDRDPVEHASSAHPGRPRGPVGIVVTAMLTLGAVAAGPALVARATGLQAQLDPHSIELPALAGWSGPTSTTDPLGASYLGTKDVRTVRYERGGSEVILQIAEYQVQGRGAEAVNDANRIYEADRWNVATQALTETANGESADVLQLRGKDVRAQRTVWRLYRIAGQQTGNPYAAKLLQVWAQLVNEPGAAVITISTETEIGGGGGALGEFWEAFAQALRDGDRDG